MQNIATCLLCLLNFTKKLLCISCLQVWSIKPEEIHCIQVHDVKEAVYDLTANSKVVCYISHGTVVKASAKCFI